MRLPANLVLIAALIAGLFGAVTAYLPPLSLGPERLAGLTLNAPAGLRRDASGGEQPIAGKNTRLTPELIATLRAAGVRRVRVKEFAVARWTGRWLFLAGCLGLVAGAWLVRRAQRQLLGGAPAGTPGAPGRSADALLGAIVGAVAGLRRELPGLAGPLERYHRTLAVLSDVQENLVPEFVALRPVLTAAIGSAGYARLMDRFAAGERQINRAWSAAADAREDEMTACLELGETLLDGAAAFLREQAQPPAA